MIFSTHLGMRFGTFRLTQTLRGTKSTEKGDYHASLNLYFVLRVCPIWRER